ncbi:uncharacterized protein LOC131235069 [Magnolia sinica]|uniref:uncharacterized protein LOC131235069 n=1 Tax=Magnolia sinica TaxID=86752 RepID=UPI00265980C6|nr:uncharacterized protein LOC131235069 [Magnolia sinica]
MATLQKFKVLATRCALSSSPSQSPNTSPAFQIRRRTTLRKLLGRGGNRRFVRRGGEPPDRDRQKIVTDPAEKKALLSHTLKDLFVSSPPLDDIGGNCTERESGGRMLGFEGGFVSRRNGAVTGRGMSGAFRYRMLRKVWRPVLVPIPE